MAGTELVWDGKYTADGSRRPVTEPVVREWTCREVWGDPAGWTNRLLIGENRDALHGLLTEFRGQVDLIYLDPPFAVGADFLYPITLGEDRSPTCRAVAYRDVWGDGPDSYLHQMWERLVLIRDLLSDTGTLYVHCDWRMNAPLRLILDEVFGAGATVSEATPGFRAEIAWLYREAVNRRTCWNRKHDTILMYTKSARWTFNADAVLNPASETTRKKYRHVDADGRRYRLMGRGISGSPIRSARDVSPEWERTRPELTFRHYEKPGTLPLDYWHMDIVNQASLERVDYPTQKPEALLERILLASSNPGDLVLDPCAGSGTTAVVAERLGRRWLACDASPWAVQTVRKRLLRLPERSQPFAIYASADGVVPGASGLACVRDGVLELAGFAPVLEALSERERAGLAERTATAPLDFVDFWAVDFDYRPGGPLHPTWHSGRQRKARALTTTVPIPADAGETFGVLTVDVFGRATTSILAGRERR